MSSAMLSTLLVTVWAGEVPYDRALRWQEQLVTARQEDRMDDVLLLLTHPPVYTAGHHADLGANLTGARPDIPVVPIDRGGDLTYHGPGQVVAYPIMRLPQRGASKAYVTALEQGIIDTVATYGVTADRRPGHPGVWVEGRDKIAAIGVRVTRGVSKHGVALNVDPDMADYDGIIPCGITDGGITSLARLGVRTDVDDVRTRLGAGLARALHRVPQPASTADLGLQ
ncbi:MAG TPA: lipoyl(octanoyl) transferase LipB [Euzebya sp.]|nr:lipoyl(octanoyl) transferase LipB [Euzebya sp.]